MLNKIVSTARGSRVRRIARRDFWPSAIHTKAAGTVVVGAEFGLRPETGSAKSNISSRSRQQQLNHQPVCKKTGYRFGLLRPVVNYHC